MNMSAGNLFLSEKCWRTKITPGKSDGRNVALQPRRGRVSFSSFASKLHNICHSWLCYWWCKPNPGKNHGYSCLAGFNWSTQVNIDYQWCFQFMISGDTLLVHLIIVIHCMALRNARIHGEEKKPDSGGRLIIMSWGTEPSEQTGSVISAPVFMYLICCELVRLCWMPGSAGTAMKIENGLGKYFWKIMVMVFRKSAEVCVHVCGWMDR